MVSIAAMQNGNGSPYRTTHPIFELKIHWEVTNAPGPGWIVQEIQRNEKYTNPKGKVDILTPNHYWECWKVELDALRRPRITPVVEEVHDVFAVGGNATTICYPTGKVTFPRKLRDATTGAGGTTGRWKIRGRVYWVPENQFDEAGWKRARDPQTGRETGTAGAVKEAGRLLSRWEKPLPGDGLRQQGTLGALLLTRTHAGEWDFVERDGWHRVRDFPDMWTDGFRGKQKGGTPG